MMTIIDYGADNIKEIKNMLRELGVECKITSDK
jgi:imidazoleglycerol phosphate synthase glutamine amidotransferase subunit HisH